MNASLDALRAAALGVLASASLVLTAAAAAGDVNAAVGKWLPSAEIGFTAWAAGQASVTTRHDYFVCGSSPQVEKLASFDYAGGACPALMKGTKFSYGPAGPTSGGVVYDRAHSIVLYYKGCCASRGFALTSNVGAPPAPVTSTDLSGVHTHSGISLGMTQAQVVAIYGAAKPHERTPRHGSAYLHDDEVEGRPHAVRPMAEFFVPKRSLIFDRAARRMLRRATQF